MKTVSRRGLLIRTSVVGLGSLLATERDLAADPADQPRLKRELLLLGPFPMGDLYTRHRARDTEPLGDCFGKGTGPSEDAIARSFNDCRLYVIDQRVRQRADRWEFAKYEEGYPKLAMEGKLFHPLKDQRGRRFSLHIAEVEHEGATTEVFRSKKTPSTRSFLVTVRLQIQGFQEREAVQADYKLLLGRCVAYNVHGKTLPLKKDG